MAAKQAKSDFAAEQRQFNEALKSGDLRRVYLLCGEQAYLRLQNRDKLVKTLLGDGDAMNLSRYSGSDVSARELIEMAQTLPFFADRRVIVLENTGLLNPRSATKSVTGSKTAASISEEADKIADFAAANGISFWQGLLDAPGAGIAGRADAKIRKFTDMIEEFRRKSADMPLDKLIAMVAADSGYTESLKEEGEIEAESRIENIDELISKAASYEAEGQDLSDRTEEGLPADLPLLNRFLEEVSLVADIDSLDEDSEKVTLMTLHAAKGLEFDEVYMTGMEDGLFPGNRSIDDPKELEEERRLCYVGITRAKRRLTMTSAKSRMINGETRWPNESMFVREIPEELKERADRTASSAFRKPVQSSYGGGYGSGSSGRTGSGGGSGSSAHRYPWESTSFASSGNAVGKRPAPAFGKQFQVVKADHLDYAEGDRVRHTRFGAGTVLKIVDGGRDFEVTVDFDGHGVKKMFAGFAKLQKL